MANPLVMIAGASAVIAVAAGFMYAYGIEFHPMQVLVVGIVFVIAVILGIIFKIFGSRDLKGIFSGPAKSVSREMLRAAKMAADFWYEMTGEEVEYRDALGTRRPYGNSGIAWGFVLYRSMNSTKPGLPVVIVMGKGKSSAAIEPLHWNDSPSPDEQEDPFVRFSAGYIGAPFPGMTPDMDAAFQGYGHRPTPGQTINIGSGNEDMRNFFEGRRRED